MSRVDAPSDVQWARALMAVVVGLVLACGILCPATGILGAKTLPPELRMLAALPCVVTNILHGSD